MWVASRYELPMLVVMVNNRGKAGRPARTPLERAHIGMAISDPEPDFAAIARVRLVGRGPVTDPAAVEDAVRRAAEHVAATGRPALVDVVCQPK
ncbi:MAG: thiamine pyrophosphate-dependent enzyme [Pseudonocardiales bacterium]|nr:thiamine pyrophosphate-dependent enzyme [Pseudonocardiales bacterium]